MKLRERIQDGQGRTFFTLVPAVALSVLAFVFWPSDTDMQDRILRGLQSIAFVAAAFAVTAYNLRTRVIDFALNVTARPDRVRDFCGIARRCGKRLTNLVLLFTVTAGLLALGGAVQSGTIFAKLLACVGGGGLLASVVSFLYVIFSFERLERLALDGAEKSAVRAEASRLFKSDVHPNEN